MNKTKFINQSIIAAKAIIRVIINNRRKKNYKDRVGWKPKSLNSSRIRQSIRTTNNDRAFTFIVYIRIPIL